MMAKNLPPQTGLLYEQAGVASVGERASFKSLLASLRATFDIPGGAGRPLLDFGHFANVIDVGMPKAIAMSTDGIGTKAIVAQMLGKYDTVGIDCVAMNANDVICVGAEPVAMLDYIAVDVVNDAMLAEIGKGLAEGARQARISIPGGEISQTPEIIKAERPGFGFDLVGTCIGTVAKDEMVTGKTIEAGDIIVGLASTGIHSNGLTLARKALFERGGFRPDQYVAELGRSVGEELLEPTRIYVREIMQLLKEDRPSVKALVHVTSDGFLNLRRGSERIGFVIDSLPEPPPIFPLIQTAASVPSTEMFLVFNMGIGFCVVVAPSAVDRVEQLAHGAGYEAWRIGYCVDDPEQTVRLETHGLIGLGGRFVPA